MNTSREEKIRAKLESARLWARSDRVLVFNPQHFATWEDVDHLLTVIASLRAIVAHERQREP